MKAFSTGGQCPEAIRAGLKSKQTNRPEMSIIFRNLLVGHPVPSVFSGFWVISVCGQATRETVGRHVLASELQGMTGFAGSEFLCLSIAQIDSKGWSSLGKIKQGLWFQQLASNRTLMAPLV